MPLEAASARALAGGPERHRARAAEQGKLPVRERVALLLDPGRSSRTGCSRAGRQDGLGAEGVVTGLGTVGGRPVAVMANDPTVKAGSWAPKTVEKILRIQERALSLRVPLVYLVDSAGARINEQVQMFPGRRHAGPDLLQPGPAVGRRAAGMRAVRPQRRRRRLHPGVLRRRDHARRQRFDVPRLAADGRDGDRREGDARGDGRRPDAHVQERRAATRSSPPTRRGSSSRGATCRTSPARSPTSRPARRRPPRRRIARSAS